MPSMKRSSDQVSASMDIAQPFKRQRTLTLPHSNKSTATKTPRPTSRLQPNTKLMVTDGLLLDSNKPTPKLRQSTEPPGSSLKVNRRSCDSIQTQEHEQIPEQARGSNATSGEIKPNQLNDSGKKDAANSPEVDNEDSRLAKIRDFELTFRMLQQSLSNMRPELTTLRTQISHMSYIRAKETGDRNLAKAQDGLGKHGSLQALRQLADKAQWKDYHATRRTIDVGLQISANAFEQAMGWNRRRGSHCSSALFDDKCWTRKDSVGLEKYFEENFLNSLEREMASAKEGLDDLRKIMETLEASKAELTGAGGMHDGCSEVGQLATVSSLKVKIPERERRSPGKRVDKVFMQ